MVTLKRSLQEKVTDQLVPENLKEPMRARVPRMGEVQQSHTQKTVPSKGYFLPQVCREKAGRVQRGSKVIKRMEELVQSKDESSRG